MVKRLLATFGACVCASAIVACSGGSGALPGGSGTAADTASQRHRIKVTMHLVITGPPKHRRRPRGRGAKFVSPSTDGILVQVYPHGDAQTPANLIASAAVNVSSGSPACGGHTGFPRTCSASVSLPPTNAVADDFALATYDAAPVSGSFANAHLLGTGSLLDQKISIGKANSLVVVVGGVIASLTGNPTSTSLPADGSQHTMAIVIDPADFGNNPIAAGQNDPFANPIVVSATESGGSGHVKFSLDGGTAATQVTVTHSTDTVQLVYDGGGTSGYYATISLAASSVQGSGGATESIQLSPLVLSSSSADFTTPNLALKGNGDELTMTISEHAASVSAYSATGTNCPAIADNDVPVGTGSSASFHVYARGTIATAPPAGGGCTIAVSDGTSTFDVAVTNTYSGTIVASPTITEFTTAAAVEEPEGITVGPDGAMWFSESATSKIGRIPVSGTAATEVSPYSSTSSHPEPDGIAPGPDGNLWFADGNFNTSTVGNVTTAGVGTIYTPAPNAEPINIVQGPDGAMWFTQENGSGLGRITTAGATQQTLITGSATIGIVVGSDGNLWFTDCNNNTVDKLTLSTGKVEEFTVPTSAALPQGITAGPDGALWFTECNTNKIGRIPTDATQATPNFTEYTGATREPLYITTGPDGALWFTEIGAISGNSVVGRLDPTKPVSGAITEYTVPTGSSSPFGISAGPDGAIWFTELLTSKVARIAIGGSAPLARHRQPARQAIKERKPTSPSQLSNR